MRIFKIKLDDCQVLEYITLDSSRIYKTLLAKMRGKQRNRLKFQGSTAFSCIMQTLWLYAAIVCACITYFVCIAYVPRSFHYLLMISFQIIQKSRSSVVACNKNIMHCEINVGDFSTYWCIMKILNWKIHLEWSGTHIL